MTNPATWVVLWTIRLYQWVFSPIKRAFFGPVGCCRFAPSCSHYAWEAFYHHGLLRGSWLSLKRLLRCHPWGGAGFDPVPAKRTNRV